MDTSARFPVPRTNEARTRLALLVGAMHTLVLLGACCSVYCVRVSPSHTPPPSAAAAALSRRAAVSAAAVLALAGHSNPAHADVKGANEGIPRGERDISDYLARMGLPRLPKSPDGCSPLIEYVGFAPPANIDGQKTKNRAYSTPLLVRFFFPNGWLVEYPSLTDNGEAGKVAAQNYQKGDSADLVSAKLPGGANVAELDKGFYKTLLTSQMSNDVYEDMKIKKVRPLSTADGAQLAIIDFTYTLNTRAGFAIGRKGVAAATAVSGAAVAISFTTTETRYKGLEDQFRNCADSFRAYAVKAPDKGFEF